MKRLLAQHSPLLILAALCLVLAVMSEQFRSTGNLQSVALRTSVVGVMAVGELFVILTAGIDLSVGSVAALSGVVAALTMKEGGMPMPVGVLAGIGAGLLCGGINGVLVTRGRIPPFIVTLGMMMAARGATLILSGSQTIFGLPDSLELLGGTANVLGGNGWLIPVLLMLAIAVVFSVLLNHTPFGRAIYAIGGSLEAARLSGIGVDKVRFGAYALCGALAGLAGVLLTARTGVATPNAGEVYELFAIAACVIGGASLMGGEGGALGCLAGALIMSVLRNYCNLENIDVNWQQVFVGALVVVLVYYDNYRKRRAGLAPG